MAAQPRIAIVHHWLVSPGGGERVLYELHKMYPQAPIYVAAYIPEKFPEFADADVRPTWINKIPWLRYKHQLFPIFLGTPFKSLDMSEYDIVISSCAAEAKYVRTGPKTLHICYCHTPVRYYWSDFEWYMSDPSRMPFGLFNPVAKVALRVLIGVLRRIDYTAAQGVDVFVANSRHIQARIQKYYHKESVVIYPPIETVELGKVPRGAGDYYLIVGRQVASKRLDVAVDAFNELGLTLKVAGAGAQIELQRSRAKANIEFLGRVSDDERDRLFAGAKALIFPPEEDFGMTPVEAMSAGTPVIAYNKGGAPEYVVDGETGVLFDDQTPGSLRTAVKRFEGMAFDAELIKTRAAAFDTAIFKKKIAELVERSWADFASR